MTLGSGAGQRRERPTHVSDKEGDEVALWQVLTAVAIAWCSGAIFGWGLGLPTQLFGQNKPSSRTDQTAKQDQAAVLSEPEAMSARPVQAHEGAGRAAAKSLSSSPEQSFIRGRAELGATVGDLRHTSSLDGRPRPTPGSFWPTQKQLEHPSPGSHRPEPSARVLDDTAFSGFNERMSRAAGGMSQTSILHRKVRRKNPSAPGIRKLRTWLELAAAALLFTSAMWGSYYAAIHLRPGVEHGR